jgi:hypothetical protein
VGEHQRPFIRGLDCPPSRKNGRPIHRAAKGSLWRGGWQFIATKAAAQPWLCWAVIFPFRGKTNTFLMGKLFFVKIAGKSQDSLTQPESAGTTTTPRPFFLNPASPVISRSFVGVPTSERSLFFVVVGPTRRQAPLQADRYLTPTTSPQPVSSHPASSALSRRPDFVSPALAATDWNPLSTNQLTVALPGRASTIPGRQEPGAPPMRQGAAPRRARWRAFDSPAWVVPSSPRQPHTSALQPSRWVPTKGSRSPNSQPDPTTPDLATAYAPFLSIAAGQDRLEVVLASSRRRQRGLWLAAELTAERPNHTPRSRR